MLTFVACSPPPHYLNSIQTKSEIWVGYALFLNLIHAPTLQSTYYLRVPIFLATYPSHGLAVEQSSCGWRVYPPAYPWALRPSVGSPGRRASSRSAFTPHIYHRGLFHLCAWAEDNKYTRLTVLNKWKVSLDWKLLTADSLSWFVQYVSGPSCGFLIKSPTFIWQPLITA